MRAPAQMRGSRSQIDALSLGTSRIFRSVQHVMKAEGMKTELKIKELNNDQDDARTARQYDPGRLRMFERTLDEYLDRFYVPKFKERDIDKVRDLVMDLLEEECKSLPRIRKFRNSTKKTSRVLPCMFEIMETIGHLQDSSEEETALYYLISKVLFGMAYAGKFVQQRRRTELKHLLLLRSK